jgi:hypothetical protein
MARFSLKQLLISVMLISTGIAMFVYGTNDPGSSYLPLILSVAASTIGAGVFMPFGRPKLGALVGFLCLFVVFLIAWLMHPVI